jgi:hypothetical protein
MIVLDALLKTAIEPALKLLPPKMDSNAARVMLLAIGLQESRFKYRFQTVHGRPELKGPAKSFWQFEKGSMALGGGVAGVVKHEASRFWLHDLCERRGVEFDNVAIWTAIEGDDVLAAGLARLLLFTDPRKLPAVDAPHEEAWQCYLRNWRPGKPHRQTWDEFHKVAVAQVMEAMT